MSDTVTIVVCDRCGCDVGQFPQDDAARTFLLLAHWKASSTCEASQFHYREERTSDRTRGRLTYAAVEEIIEAAYELGRDHGENVYRSRNGQPTQRASEGWVALAKEIWDLIKKRRRFSGETKEED